jgi:hypothetical protein
LFDDPDEAWQVRIGLAYRVWADRLQANRAEADPTEHFRQYEDRMKKFGLELEGLR